MGESLIIKWAECPRCFKEATDSGDNQLECPSCRIFWQKPAMKKVDWKEERACAEKSLIPDPELLKQPIEVINLCVRSQNALDRIDVRTLGDLIKKTEGELMRVRNFGLMSLVEVRHGLANKNLQLVGKNLHSKTGWKGSG